jgi:hypothetical protein
MSEPEGKKPETPAVIPNPAPGEPVVNNQGGAVGGAKSTKAETNWTRFLSFLPAIGAFGVGLTGLGLGAAIVWGLFTPHSIVRDLGNADLARGVITFIFAIGTIGIALLVTLGALIGDHTDQQLGRGKEVLTVLIGVFGTILGFYFGAANTNAQKLELADIRITGTQLTTHVTGGTAPYRYSITSSEKEFKQVKDQVSTDGWIIQQIDPVPKAGKITVDVIDSRDLKGSRDRPLSPEGTPTPAPGSQPAGTPKAATPGPTSSP